MWEYNYLEHHGILGQKWGKRNGPPYPLSSSDHSASEKRAGWRKSLSQKTSEKQKKRDVRNRGALSNEELRQKIERLKLEKELRNLTNEELKRGRKATGRFLGEIGKEVAKKYLVNTGYNFLLYFTDAKINNTKFDKKAFARSLTKISKDKDSENNGSNDDKKKNEKNPYKKKPEDNEQDGN